MSYLIPVVDIKDKIIGYKNRNEIQQKDIYRVSALWITNSQNKILLAKRHHTKKNNPNKWGPSVAGTVEKNETYKINIIKEANEELSLIKIKPKIGPKTFSNGEHRHFTQWYFLKIDKQINELKFQESEVEKIKWFSLQEIKQKLKTNPDIFLPNFKKYFKLFS